MTWYIDGSILDFLLILCCDSAMNAVFLLHSFLLFLMLLIKLDMHVDVLCCVLWLMSRLGKTDLNRIIRTIPKLYLK